jgi:membrane-associated phospholipid phosphatase
MVKSPRPAIAGCLICAVALLALMLLAFLNGAAQRLDGSALYGFGTLDSGALRLPVWGFALVGGFFPLALGLIVLYFLAARWGRPRQAIAAIGVVIAANLTTEILKLALAHPRIQPILGAHQVSPASFPSGHATSAMSMAVASLLVVPQRWRAITAVTGAGFVFAVSFSILILTWHFPSDVLGGLLVASGYGFAAVALLRYFETEPAGRRMTLIVGERLPRRALEVIWVIALLGVGSLALSRASAIFHYAGTYTATVAAALVISAMAAMLLGFFSFTAAE